MSEQEAKKSGTARTFFGKLAETVLVGAVESIVRAGSKAVESLADDAAKALEKERRKIDSVRKNVESWRQETVGEIIVDSEVTISTKKEERKS
jgi:hypothetical protein